MPRFFSATYDEESSDDDLVSSDEELLYTSEEETSEEELLEEEEKSQEPEEEDEESDEYWGETSSEEEELSSSDDDDFGHKPRGRSYFLKKSAVKGSGVESEESEEESEEEEQVEGKKVVKSAKDKYLDEIADLVDEIENYSMVQDWVNIGTRFDKLLKLVSKYPQHHIAIPRQYVKCLAILTQTLEDYEAHQKESKRKLNASESKSLNIIRQRVKKYSKECPRELKAYHDSPEAFLATDGSISLSVTPSVAASREASKAPATAEDLKKVFFNALKAILETRGKRNVDQREQLSTLLDLLSSAKTPYEQVSVLLLAVAIRFDLHAKSNFMPSAEWKLALADVNKLLDIINANRKYVVTETAVAPDNIAIEPKPNANGQVEVVGSIASFVERLCDEITYHLLTLDPHSTEYIVRLRDESSLYTTLLRVQLYYERFISASDLQKPQGAQLVRVILKRLESVYYKPTKLIIFSEMNSWKAIDASENSWVYPRLSGDLGPQKNLQYTNGLVDSLCSVLYKQTNSAFRKKAVLCHIYNYALNDQYYKARDMLLLSHLQSSIHTADPQLQIYFNRALVQLGLSAFRKGLMHEAQQLLQEVVTSSRQKELLGQGVQRFQVQQSQVDKQRLLPFHMHINLELLECSFYTASLLIEVPLMAEYDDYAKRRQSSPKAFRRVLEYRERQVFDGPPENARDHVMLAARSLGKCDWKTAANLLMKIQIWSLFNNSEEIKHSIVSELKIQGLRTFIFKNRASFTKCSISSLSEMFELTESKVKAVIAKLIRNDDVHALINLRSNTVDFTQGEDCRANKLQQLVLNLSDKCSQIIERNEKLSIGGYQIQLDIKKFGQGRSATVQGRK